MRATPLYSQADRTSRISQKTRQHHATEFLASQMERAKRLTNWSALEQGQHQVVAVKREHPRQSLHPQSAR
jgi:hypothetical protein